MRLRLFLAGVLVGVLVAPASGRETWQMLRNRLAASIDAVLRLGTSA
ncbi:MAG TPA: YtxH domain-containing protein [Kouleothrix sp.]|jgi:gas vesicle protein|nr:YtxH domain-containing protein [Kouleothrix sp.]